MGIMKDLDIEFKNAPNHIKYLKHELERLEKRITKIEGNL
jgi:predicted  nucleic acid-binding Zn-ribbon protein